MPKNRTDWDTQTTHTHTHTQRCRCCCCYLNALTKPVSKYFPTPWLPFFFVLPPPSRTLLHVRFATLWERALRTTEQEIPSSYCKKLDKISLVCLYVSFCLGLRLYLSRALNGVFEISIAHRKPSQGSHKGARSSASGERQSTTRRSEKVRVTRETDSAPPLHTRPPLAHRLRRERVRALAGGRAGGRTAIRGRRRRRRERKQRHRATRFRSGMVVQPPPLRHALIVFLSAA